MSRVERGVNRPENDAVRAPVRAEAASRAMAPRDPRSGTHHAPPSRDLMNVDGSDAELHDIEQDPREQRDRKADSPAIFEDLSSRLASWITTLPPPGAARRAP